MRTRHSGFSRTASFVSAAILACGLLATGHPGMASDCACGGDSGGCVCSQTPRLEEFSGWSLFWHDPCSTPTYCWAGEHYSHLAQAPQVYVMVDFLPLVRDQSGWTPFQAAAYMEVEEIRDSDGLLVDTVTTYPREAVLSTSSFDNELKPGERALVGVALSDWYRLEFSYLGLHSWSDSAAVRYNNADSADGNLLSPFSSFGDLLGRARLDPLPDDGSFHPIEGWDYNELASISFSSELDSAELNVRRRVCMPANRHVAAEMSCLVGLRYMQVREDFGYFTQSPLPDLETQNAVDVRTQNDLFGVQLGALAQFLVHNRAWIDLQAKGAFLLNRAESRVVADVHTIVEGQAELAAGELNDEVDCASFLGDISLQFNYQFAPSWTIRAGYNAMWLTGVALASENFVGDASTLLYGPASVDHSGSVVYHGPNIGLIWTR